MPRRFAAALLSSALIALLAPAGALAAGSPNLGLAASAPAKLLLGRTATVTLTASNPSAEPYGYNLTFRDVLPAGVGYVAGSSCYLNTAPRTVPAFTAAGVYASGATGTDVARRLPLGTPVRISR